MKLGIRSTYRHEIRNTLLSRATVGVMILAVLAGASALVTVESVTNSFPISGSAIVYYQNGAYHVTGWAYDGGGSPVSDVAAEFTEVTFGNNTTTAGPYWVKTNGQGEFELSVPVPDNASAYLMLNFAALDSSRPVQVVWNGILSFESEIFLGYLPPGAAVGSNNLAVVGTDFYSAHAQFMTFLEGPNGSAPTGLEAVTCSTVPSFTFPPRFNCTGLPTHALGAISGYWSTFPLPTYPSNDSVVFIEVVNATGGVQETLQTTSTKTTEGSSAVVNSAPGESILTTFAEEGSFFLPAVALVSAYWAYARPRLSGTVEPVLAGPVTRRGLFVTRYACVALMVLAAAIVDLFALDAGATWMLGEALPTGYILPLLGGLIVAGLGSVGLVFLVAHLVRTPGGSLGAASVPLGLGFFWSSLVLGLLVLDNPNYNGSTATLFLLRSQLFFPPQFTGLTTSLAVGISTFGTPLESTPGGVSFPVIALVGFLWVVIPVIAAYRLAISRD